MNIKSKLNEIREILLLFDDPKDKFVQLMDMAKESSTLDNEQKIDENKIRGCTSQAWLIAELNDDDTYVFKTDSDALIVKGLLSILEEVFSCQPVDEVLQYTSDEILKSVGLDRVITSQRTNGFSSAFIKLQSLIK